MCMIDHVCVHVCTGKIVKMSRFERILPHFPRILDYVEVHSRERREVEIGLLMRAIQKSRKPFIMTWTFRNGAPRSAFRGVCDLCIGLRKIDASCCQYIDSDTVSYIVDNCPCLTHLEIGGNDSLTTDCVCNILTKMPQLIYLDVSECAQVSAQSVLDTMCLGHKEIRSVDLSGTKYHDSHNRLMDSKLASRIDILCIFNPKLVELKLPRSMQRCRDMSSLDKELSKRYESQFPDAFRKNRLEQSTRHHRRHIDYRPTPGQDAQGSGFDVIRIISGKDDPDGDSDGYW